MANYKKLSLVKLTPNFREATKVVEAPLRPPNDDEILLKILYSGVNATDINISAGRYLGDGKLPSDIGLEALGVVEQIGKNINGFKVGQPVMKYGSNCYAEYLYVKPEELLPIPSVKPEFISFLICGLTATIGLDQCGRIKSGDKVLITAAAGGTGHIGVQWAKLKGCHVIGTCSSKEKVEFLKNLGCDRVINYKEESIDDVLAKEYPDGVDVVWETIGGTVFETLFKHLAKRGRLVIIGGIQGYQSVGFPQVHFEHLPRQLLRGSKSLNGFFLPDFADLYKEYLTQLIRFFEQSKLKVVLDFGEKSQTGPFHGIDTVVNGVEHLHNGKNVGKVVIKIH